MAEFDGFHRAASLTGTAGDDSLTGTTGADSLAGLDGDDTLDGAGGGFDTLRGGSGDDRLDPGGGSAYLFGDDGNDSLVGAGDLGITYMEGGAGNDVFEGHANIATRDFAVYVRASSGIVVDLRRDDAQHIGGGQGFDALSGVWGVYGSAFSDRLVGGGANGFAGRELLGLGGNDTLQGDGRGMILHGGEGDDLLIGGTGVDSANYGAVWLDGVQLSGPTGGVTVNLAAGGPQAVGGGMGVDTFVSIENVNGGAFGDTLGGGSGANAINGGAGDDSLSGLGDADLLFGADGADSLYGGEGDDNLDGGPGANLLRGEAGDDVLRGGQDFDDLHGNMGDDTLTGGGGDDWVVGGKDGDSLAGDGGGDIVFGNLGGDTCDGGDGGDIVRGGQDDDIVRGGGGDDFVSGDRGSDTISGGLGADTFHTFGAAGLDHVLDFDRAQGDRVLVSEGGTWTVSQQGADVVVDLVGGGRMVLAGVQLSTLTDGWITAA